MADGGSGEDTVEASGIGLNRATSYFAEALAASGRFLRGLEWESLALSDDMRSWSLAGTSLFSVQRTQMQAMIAAAGQ